MSNSLGISLMIIMIAIILVLLVSNIREAMDSHDMEYSNLFRRHSAAERKMQWKQGAQKIQEVQRSHQANGGGEKVERNLLPVIMAALVVVLSLLVCIIFTSSGLLSGYGQTVETYYDNGTVMSQVKYYRNGNTAEEIQYYPDGGLKYDCQFNTDGMVDNENYYYKNGTLHVQKFYFEGILYSYTEYDKKGDILREEAYEEGLLCQRYDYKDAQLSRRTEYWENGNVRIQEDYDEVGDIISVIYTQEDGSPGNSWDHAIDIFYGDRNTIEEFRDREELENGQGYRTYTYDKSGQLEGYELELTVPDLDDHLLSVYLTLNSDDLPIFLQVSNEAGDEYLTTWNLEYDDQGNYMGPELDHVITDKGHTFFQELEITFDERGDADGVVVR